MIVEGLCNCCCCIFCCCCIRRCCCTCCWRTCCFLCAFAAASAAVVVIAAAAAAAVCSPLLRGVSSMPWTLLGVFSFGLPLTQVLQCLDGVSQFCCCCCCRSSCCCCCCCCCCFSCICSVSPRCCLLSPSLLPVAAASRIYFLFSSSSRSRAVSVCVSLQRKSWTSAAWLQMMIAAFFPLLLLPVAALLGICLHALHEQAAAKYQRAAEKLALNTDLYISARNEAEDIGAQTLNPKP